MPVTDWLYPSTVGTHAGHTNVGLGTGVWYATPRIKAADGSSAYIGPDGTNLANAQLTEWLRAEGFSPTIPSDAILTGFEVRVYLRRRIGAAQFFKISLVRAGIFQVSSVKTPSRTLSGSYEMLTFGGERDKWDYALDRAAALDSTFGIRLQCKATAAATNIDVDYVQARFHYTQTQAFGAPNSVDFDYQSAATARLGTITLTPGRCFDVDAQSSATALLGTLTLTPSANVDFDYVVDASHVGPSNYFYVIQKEPTYDYDVCAEPSVLLSSVGFSAAASVDVDAQSDGAQALYGSVEFGAPNSEDLDAQVAGITSVAIPINNAPRSIDYDAQVSGIVQVIWSILVLHDDFLRNSQQSQVQAFPLLVTISHKDLPSPLRFTDAGETVVSRGESYLALPISVSLPTSGRNQRAEGSIVLPIQSRQVRGIFRTLTGKPATVKIEMVRGSDMDIVEDVWVMRLAATETGQNVVLSLNDGDFEDRQFPPLVFDGRWQAVHD